jgi:NADPH:quinone reductase-like Zn-dependent oxidoreductase
MSKIVQFSALGGPEVLQFIEVEPAPPSQGEVQIAMAAAGLNRAELLFMAGAYLLPPVMPSRLGFEGAGEVLAVGAGVTGFAPGDRVAITPAFQQDAYGVLGEVINIPANALEPIPATVSYRDASAFWMAYGTAYGVLVQCGGLKAEAGQTVLVTAASSSVGIAAIQLARAHGAIVIATTRGHAKTAALKAAGADYVITTDTEDVATRVREITAGRGFDIAADAVVGQDLARISAAAARDATVVVYGLLSGNVGALPFGPMVMSGVKLTGFHLAWSLLDVPEQRRSAVRHLNDGLLSGTYRPTIDCAFAFTELFDAYTYMAANRNVGKIIVDF